MRKRNKSSCSITDCYPDGSYCSLSNLEDRHLSLNDLVTQFIRKHREKGKRYLRYYQIQGTLQETIEKAALSVLPGGKRHGHQRRIPQRALKEATARLLTEQHRISECRNFEELIDVIEKTVSSIHGIGDLTIYDISHRIGAKLGLYPEAVFLHAGTTEGAKALELDHKRRAIPVDQFPKPIQRLEPYEIEDFLCICKKNIKLLS